MPNFYFSCQNTLTMGRFFTENCTVDFKEHIEYHGYIEQQEVLLCVVIL